MPRWAAKALPVQREQRPPPIPVTFVLGSDPVQLGLVGSLARPGGNVTGVVQFTTALESKRLGLLHEMIPKADPIAALVNPTRSVGDAQRAEIEEAAARLGIKVAILTAQSEPELEVALATLTAQQVGALLVAADPFFFSRRQQLVELVARHKVPAMYEFRDFPVSGGLMSYGTDLANAYRENGVYVGRILRGAKPSDLPVMRSTRFEFVINLKAAKGLGLNVPNSMQLLADEVIE